MPGFYRYFAKFESIYFKILVTQQKHLLFASAFLKYFLCLINDRGSCDDKS